MKMNVCCVTRARKGFEECTHSWGGNPEFELCENGNLVQAMQTLFDKSTEEVICYLHDDVIIRETNWYERVMKQFEDPKVGVVGFGGSLWHGSPDIYKIPYHISQLGRSYYMSNTDDAEVHGARFTGERDIATLDGFSLAVRRSLMDRLHGWPVGNLSFHGYDHWITLSSLRMGLRCRLLGIRCQHLGGQTYTKVNPDPTDHERAHKFLYNEFRDVLPVMVKP